MSTNAHPTAGAAPSFDDFDREVESTRRVLARFPDGRGDWRPHAKSRTIGQLASHVANIPIRGTSILETVELDMTKQAPPAAPPTTAAELVAAFDANVAGLRAAMAAASTAELSRDWTLRAGDRVILRQSKGSLLRLMVLSHIIHHRAQLGVYYRLLDIPVPGVYGPSADEPI